jgi:hypothetical protein
VAVVDQYATSVSFAHSLPYFSCGRRRPFSDVGASREQAVCMAKAGSAVSGILVFVLRNSTGFGPARPVQARGSRWRHHYTTSACRPSCRP